MDRLHHKVWYLDLALCVSLSSLNTYIMYSNFVPISLIVTMEVVKFAQAQFIQWDT
jgi:magnesium-transporting ATPase (P-type)